MPRLALHLLGSPRIECDGTPIEIDTRKAVALIAYLVVTGQRHGRDILATLLWPEYDQPHARGALRRTLSTLNKALAGDCLLEPHGLDLVRGDEPRSECVKHGNVTAC